jgi:mRNA interferase MazF
MFQGKDGFILLEQTRALDKRRLSRRVGELDRKTLSSVLATMREMFAE